MQTLFHDLGINASATAAWTTFCRSEKCKFLSRGSRTCGSCPGMEWITALRAPAVAALARDGGPLHMPALLGWANSRNLVLGALDARSTSVEEAFHADKPLAAAALTRTTATSAGQAQQRRERDRQRTAEEHGRKHAHRERAHRGRVKIAEPPPLRGLG